VPRSRRRSAGSGLSRALAYELGLQSRFRFDDDGYRFHRSVPDPKYEDGLSREEEAAVDGTIDVPLPVVAMKVVAVLNDVTWPIRKLPGPGGAKPEFGRSDSFIPIS
jgi:hypothetical protein